MENQTNNNSVPAGGTSQIANPLLKRAFMFLEDGNWESADEYCEKVLDQNPEDAYAYLGKLMAELKVGRKEALADCEQPFSDSSNYQKVLRFGSKTLIQEVEEYHKSAVEKLHKEFAQLREKIAPYQTAFQGMICCADDHIVGLCADGSVVAAGSDLGDHFNVQGWRDIIGITSVGSDIFALRSNGTVTKETHGSDNENDWGVFFEEYRQEIKRWKNVVAISGGGDGFFSKGHIVGLHADGTVVAAGNNNNGQCNVEAWHDIVAIAAGTDHTVGLHADGTVVSTKYPRKDDIFARDQVQNWRNIIAIAAGKHTVGLRSDGTVAITGGDGDRPFDRSQIRAWHNIVAIAAGDAHVIGLCSDGTVVAPEMNDRRYRSQCDVEEWRNVVAVMAHGKNSAALCANGSVIAGNTLYEEDVQKWDLFCSGGIDGCIERFKARKARAEKAEAERKAAVERAEAERRAAIEKAEAERKAAKEKARAAAEKRRQEKITALEAERADLQARVLAVQNELANLKGLFTGRRRKELEGKTAEIMSRLDAISKELKTLGAKR